MHYYIDGYNLLFRLIKQGDEDLQKQRELFVEDLSQKINSLNIDATIVFDSFYQKGMRARSFKLNFEVLFTDEGETADDCIIDELKKMPNTRLVTVVTSDKKLAWQARLKGAHTQTVEEFVAFLHQRWRKKMHPPEKIKKTESPPLAPIKEKEEVIEEFYLRTFEESLSQDPYFKNEQKRKEKRKTDFERWLEAFENGEREDGA